MGRQVAVPFDEFFRQWSSQIDIFCLQEVFDTDQEGVDRLHLEEYVCGPLFTKLSAALPDFNGSCASFNDNPEEPNLADYIPVSTEMNVHEFRVLPDIVSGTRNFDRYSRYHKE